jgi:tRNA 2-thiouridine synthesizing protein E
MNTLLVKDKNIITGPDGRLDNLADWTPEAAAELARADGLELGEDHWLVINTMRDYYSQYNISPIRKLLKKHLARNHSPDKASDKFLDSLFPNGVQYQGTRISGLPVPMLDSEREPSAHIQATGSATREHPQIDFAGETIVLYPSGNLAQPEQWSHGLANVLAEREGISLSDDHWLVIRYLRKFYFHYGITPMVKLLIHFMQDELGKTNVDQEEMYRLFPKGPARQGSRVAGLPDPQGCIDP